MTGRRRSRVRRVDVRGNQPPVAGRARLGRGEVVRKGTDVLRQESAPPFLFLFSRFELFFDSFSNPITASPAASPLRLPSSLGHSAHNNALSRSSISLGSTLGRRETFCSGVTLTASTWGRFRNEGGKRRSLAFAKAGLSIH